MPDHPARTPLGQGRPPAPQERPAGPAWAAWAEELATWTMRWLVNRTDAWGQYLPLRERTDKKKARTVHGKLTLEVLGRHYRGADPGHLVGVHTTSPDNRSRCLAVELDQHGEPDEEKHRRNQAAALALYDRAVGLGFDPLLTSSDDRGGYHLRLLFDRPAPTPEVFAFGRWLVRDWRQLGLEDEPEVFPKQPRLGGKIKYGNYLRLPGRHHTRSYYSEVWTGKRWARGADAVRVILGKKGASPDRIPEEARRAATGPPEAAAAPAAGVPAGQLSQVQRRALALLGKTLRAVQGRQGDRATWTAALYLVKDFALTVEQALPVLLAWNRTSCRPPWAEADLRRKLERAEAEPGPRGRLLAGGPAAADAGAVPAAGTPFVAEVPDFVLADWDAVQPRAPAARRGRPSPVLGVVLALARAEVVRQRCSRVYLPDVLLGQLLWGGDRGRWPRHWRRELHRRYLRCFELRVEPGCPPPCPLHGRGDVPHRHLRLTFLEAGKDLGCLHHFRVGRKRDGDARVYAYDFGKLQSHHRDPGRASGLQARIDAARKTGQLFSVYLPAWLLAPLVLPPGPCRLLQALTRELTRKGARRPDHAQLIPGTACPLLDPRQHFVAFNGNKGRYHGAGYRLATWLRRAGYAGGDGRCNWAGARAFLRDLQVLAGPLGLVAGGYRRDQGAWEPLGRLADMTRSEAGRSWLQRCVLRVFAAEDYLAAWRRHFAEALGFTLIPGGLDQPPAAPPAGGAAPCIRSALELDAWMRQSGVTERDLARRLDVSQALVSFQRSGKRPWSPRFQARLAAHLAEDAAGQGPPAPGCNQGGP
jgi:hypothetical protein